MPVNLYYTQKVRGFQQKHVEYFPEKAVYELKRTTLTKLATGLSASLESPKSGTFRLLPHRAAASKFRTSSFSRSIRNPVSPTFVRAV